MSENNKSIKRGFLQSAKARLLVFGGVAVVVIAVVIAVAHHMYAEKAYQGSATVAHTPAIQSVPGTGDPSDQYVKLQNIQNAKLDQQARKAATSSIPTITRASFVGSDSSFDNAEQQQGEKVLDQLTHPATPHDCPLKKIVYMYRPNPANCSVDNLKRARDAGVTAEELTCQACSCPALRQAGYTAGEMKDTGYQAKQLKACGYSLDQLVNAGFSAKDLKDAGYSADQLRKAGFSAGQLAAAGFTPDQLKAAGFTAQELKAAGVGAAKIGCSVAAIKKERAQGMSASQLKSCGLAALKAAGFSAKELKDAGFSAKQLKDAGFSAKQLKNAGFNAAELENAGFSDKDLKNAGFTAAQIKAAHVASQNCSISELRKERTEGVSATELRKRGCGLAALKAAGFTAGELRAAGFTAAQLKDAGFSAKDLKNAGFSAAELKAAGFSAKDLKDAGFSAAALKGAGFSAADLKHAGFRAAQLKAAGFNANDLKNAGFSAAALKNAGFSAVDLKKAGFSAGDLKAAGFSAKDLKNAGFSAKALRDAGFNAADLKAAGFTPKALKAAGFTQGDLLRAGFGAKDLGLTQHTAAAPAKVQQAPVKKPDLTDQSSLPSVSDASAEGRLRALQQAEQQVMSQQRRQDLQQQIQLQMMGQAQKMMGTWSNPSKQMREESTYKPQEDKGSSDYKDAKGSAGPTFKAGDIMFAVLDTSVDSDDTNTPVLATIVTGKLKGTKLIGGFTRIKTHLLVKFTRANVPGIDHTFGINAVAVDPRSAHSVLSGFVDNHYFLRYGSLFASSFLSGMAQGVIQSATGPCLGIFGCFQPTQKLKPSEYVMLGLGNAGQQYANVMGSNFNTPPTVRIPGGVGIGILYMSDVTLPQALPKKDHSVAPGLQLDNDSTE